MTSVNERFWAKVDATGECHVWMNSVDTSGYGLFWWGDRNMRAHRAAWLLAGRELPPYPEYSIDHICRNRICVRVEHLRVATSREQQINAGLQSNNKSGVRGVHWCAAKEKWKLMVECNGKKHFGGYFSDLDQARSAALKLYERLHGSQTHSP